MVHQIYQNSALRFNSGIFQVIGGKMGPQTPVNGTLRHNPGQIQMSG